MAVRVSFDSLTLKAVADQLARRLVGGAVQHIAQPAPQEVVLTVRRAGANHALLLSADAAHPRGYLTSVKRPNPPTPPAFCMLCRKYLEGARVRAVEQRAFDRILDVELESPAGVRYLLVAEFMGKHSNILLVDEGGVVLDAIKHVTHRLSRHRETLPGRRYVAPPGEERADPFAADPRELAEFAVSGGDTEALAARLMARFAGLSPFLAAELAERTAVGSLPEAWEELFGAAAAGLWSPVVLRNARSEPVGAYPFPSIQFPAESQNERADISTALDHYYGVALPRAALDAARNELMGRIRQAVKGRQRQRESALRTLEEGGRAEQYRLTGELLLANLHLAAPEATAVTVTDYYADPPQERTIVLDPGLTARENADVFFRRYRKSRDGASRQQEQLDRVTAELDALAHAIARLDEVRDVAAISGLRRELTEQGLLRPEGGEGSGPVRDRPDFSGKKVRVFHTPEGYDIYVGENSEANDYVTGKIAAPNDWWLHVRANTSAHVVIRTRNAPQAVPRAVLERAALLAAQHSAAKHSSMVPVDYTLKKHVRRPRGAASGFALYQNEKTIYVTPRDS